MTRRTISSQEAANQRRGGTRIAPGIWVDRAGGVHVSIEELLVFYDVDDTPANRLQLAEAVRAQLTLQQPGIDIIEQEEQSH